MLRARAVNITRPDDLWMLPWTAWVAVDAVRIYRVSLPVGHVSSTVGDTIRLDVERQGGGSVSTESDQHAVIP